MTDYPQEAVRGAGEGPGGDGRVRSVPHRAGAGHRGGAGAEAAGGRDAQAVIILITRFIISIMGLLNQVH